MLSPNRGDILRDNTLEIEIKARIVTKGRMADRQSLMKSAISLLLFRNFNLRGAAKEP